jgi:hypothetical protein
MQHINRTKDKNHTILSIDAEKAFNKIPCLFMIKALKKRGREGTFLYIIKTVRQTQSQHHTNGEQMKPFPLKSGKK